MRTSSNENISALLALCAGNSPVAGEFPTQRPVTRNFDVSFDLRLNRQLSKQSWDWWFETQSCSLWRHCIAIKNLLNFSTIAQSFYMNDFLYKNVSLLTTVIFTVMGIVEMYHLYVIYLYALLEVVIKTLQYKHHHSVREHIIDWTILLCRFFRDWLSCADASIKKYDRCLSDMVRGLTFIIMILAW